MTIQFTYLRRESNKTMPKQMKYARQTNQIHLWINDSHLQCLCTRNGEPLNGNALKKTRIWLQLSDSYLSSADRPRLHTIFFYSLSLYFSLASMLLYQQFHRAAFSIRLSVELFATKILTQFSEETGIEKFNGAFFARSPPNHRISEIIAVKKVKFQAILLCR